jgi:hypothetical protein
MVILLMEMKLDLYVTYMGVQETYNIAIKKFMKQVHIFKRKWVINMYLHGCENYFVDYITMIESVADFFCYTFGLLVSTTQRI